MSPDETIIEDLPRTKSEVGDEPLPSRTKKTRPLFDKSSKKEFKEDLIKDELPEVTINNYTELQSFLEKYRNAMNHVFDEELNWKARLDPYTRCGITAAMISRALYEKPNVVGLQHLDVRRLNHEPYDLEGYKGVDLAEITIHDISKDTGQNTETVRQILSDLGHVANWWYEITKTGENITMQDSKIREYFEETVKEYPESQGDTVQKVWEFYNKISLSKPELIDGVLDYVDSGWEHVVVMLDIHFKGKLKPDRYIIDANSEQFGEAFDKSYVLPIHSAWRYGYTLKDSDPVPKKMAPEKLMGTTDIVGETVNYYTKTQNIPIPKVSRMIALKYRQNNTDT